LNFASYSVFLGREIEEKPALSKYWFWASENIKIYREEQGL